MKLYHYTPKENNFNSGIFSLGAKFNERFSVETFYQQSLEAEGKYNIVKTSFIAQGFDMQFTNNLINNFNLIGSLGVARYYVEAKIKSYKENENGFGFRYGLGLQYNIDEHIALRTMGRYTTLASFNSVSDIKEVTFGFRYTF